MNMNVVRIKKIIRDLKGELNIDEYKVSKFVLSQHEILYYFNFIPSKFQKEKDFFMFLLLQGVRVSDMKDLQPLDIIKVRGKYFIEKETIKTRSDINLELHPESKRIWDLYNHNFKILEKDFNERLKFIFKEFFLWYKPFYEKEFNDEYDLKMIKKVKRAGVKELKTEVFKHEVISTHYGRGSYISNLSVSGKLSISEIMTRTGQKDIETVVGYMNESRYVSPESIFPLVKIPELNIFVESKEEIKVVDTIEPITVKTIETTKQLTIF